jgi:muramidase (phage lysozyme)
LSARESAGPDAVLAFSTGPASTSTTTVRASSSTTTAAEDERPSPQARTVGKGDEPPAGDAPLACIRSYEQGADGYATDTGNGFAGAYQFDRETWQSVGGKGNPADASPAEQDMRAEMLYDRRGLAPWPTPEAMCA